MRACAFSRSHPWQTQFNEVNIPIIPMSAPLGSQNVNINFWIERKLLVHLSSQLTTYLQEMRVDVSKVWYILCSRTPPSGQLTELGYSLSNTIDFFGISLCSSYSPHLVIISFYLYGANVNVDTTAYISEKRHLATKIDHVTLKCSINRLKYMLWNISH